MQISAISQNLYSTSFRGEKTQDQQTRNFIREGMEKNLDSSAKYLHEMNTIDDMKYTSLVRQLHGINRSNEKSIKKEHQVKVDEEKIKNAKVGFFWVRQPNELYSGGYMVSSDKKDTPKILKEAGINSVLALIHCDTYEENCKNAGLNYIDIRKIGNGNLRPFDIKYDMLKNLIKNPEMYADGNEDAKTKDLKEFIKLMKGENENYPYPIYYGCTQGSNMTSCWSDIYKILKDQDPTQPLTPEVVERLKELVKDIEYVYRD